MTRSIATLALSALTMALLPSNGLPQDRAEHPTLSDVEQIYILPVLDARGGERKKLNFNEIRNNFRLRVKTRHYKAFMTDEVGVPGGIVQEDLEDAKPEWVKRLGPQNARWVMVLGLADANSKISGGIGSSGAAVVFGYLFDKQDGTTVWSGNAAAKEGQGGLLGMAIKGAMGQWAADEAAMNLADKVPKRPKK